MSRHSEPRYSDDWDGAVCAQLGAVEADKMFFSTAAEAVKEAITMCLDCPLRARCATLALEEEAGEPAYIRAGIRGGLTPEQRATLTPQRLCPDCGTPTVGRAERCDTDRAARRRKTKRDNARQRRAA